MSLGSFFLSCISNTGIDTICWVSFFMNYDVSKGGIVAFAVLGYGSRLTVDLYVCLCLSWLSFTCFWFSVPFRHGERIGFSYLVSQKYTGDSAAIKVLRNSETIKFNIKLASHRRLIPAHNKGKPPSYYIIAGFVFTTVSVPYLRSEVLILFQYNMDRWHNHVFFLWALCFNFELHGAVLGACIFS